MKQPVLEALKIELAENPLVEEPKVVSSDFNRRW